MEVTRLLTLACKLAQSVWWTHTTSSRLKCLFYFISLYCSHMLGRKHVRSSLKADNNISKAVLLNIHKTILLLLLGVCHVIKPHPYSVVMVSAPCGTWPHLGRPTTSAAAVRQMKNCIEFDISKSLCCLFSIHVFFLELFWVYLLIVSDVNMT